MSTLAERHLKLMRLVSTLVATSAGLINYAVADEVVMAATGELYRGRITYLDDTGLKLDVECKGQVVSLSKQKYSWAIFNSKCKGKTSIEPFGGDPDGCPGGYNDGRGARSYMFVLTKKEQRYALSTGTFDGNSLHGTLLVSQKSIEFHRQELQHIAHETDCYFNDMRN